MAGPVFGGAMRVMARTAAAAQGGVVQGKGGRSERKFPPASNTEAERLEGPERRALIEVKVVN